MEQQQRTGYTVAQLAAELGLEFSGDAKHVIESVASPQSAQSKDLCFLQSARFRRQLEHSQCGAVIVRPDQRKGIDKPAVLYSDNPYLSFVQAIHLFGLDPSAAAGEATIDPSARIASSAKLGNQVSIGANSVIGDGVVIADDVSIGAGCVVDDRVQIGTASQLIANVTMS